jgi:hypothetical protein
MESLVGQLSTIESETGDVFTYELVAGDGENDADNTLFYTIGDMLYINTTSDFETQSSYAIYLRTTDSYGQTFDTDFVIDVIDVNETPIVGNAVPDQEAEVSHPYYYQIPTDLFVDVDAGDVLTVTAMQEDGEPLPAWLSFDGSIFSGTPITPEELSIKIHAVDLGLLFADVVFHLEITPTVVSEVAASNMKVYPIPADAYLSIEVHGITQKQMANVVDAKGDIVKKVMLCNGVNTIDVTELSAGLYSIRCDSFQSVNIVIR